MNSSKILSAVFGFFGLIAAVACVVLSFAFMDASPVLLEQPESAAEQVTALMDAVCQNDYAAASGMIRGNPDFGVDREPEDAVSALIWDAFVESVSYEVNGALYATDSGVAQNITITTLDLSSVTSVLKDRSTVLLEERVAEAEDPDEVYDENNDYREDFVMQVLYDAAVQALESDARTVSTEVTINMVYENDQWWIVADSQLLRSISGGILN